MVSFGPGGSTGGGEPYGLASGLASAEVVALVELGVGPDAGDEQAPSATTATKGIATLSNRPVTMCTQYEPDSLSESPEAYVDQRLSLRSVNR